MKRKEKIGIYSILILFLIILTSNSIIALEDVNVTILIPQNNYTNVTGGSIVFNISFHNGTAITGTLPGPQNYSVVDYVYLQSAGQTSNSSLYIANGTNSTNACAGTHGVCVGNITMTLPTLALQDGTDYTLTISLWNGSNHVNDTITITISNGVPTATLSANNIHNNYKISVSDTFITAIDSDVDIGINNCTVIARNTRNDSIITRVTAETNDACSNTTHNIANFGFKTGECYNIFVQASDGQGDKVNSTSRTLCANPISFKKGDDRRDIISPKVSTQSIVSNAIKNLILKFQSFIKGIFSKF